MVDAEGGSSARAMGVVTVMEEEEYPYRVDWETDAGQTVKLLWYKASM